MAITGYLKARNLRTKQNLRATACSGNFPASGRRLNHSRHGGCSFAGWSIGRESQLLTSASLHRMQPT
eukprot:5045620-Alexandrium_andersonii.AAC.1